MKEINFKKSIVINPHIYGLPSLIQKKDPSKL